MNRRNLALLRLRAQRLAGPPLEDAEAVVGHLTAVQSQDYPLARWSIGQRTVASTEGALDALLAHGRILRTHILRPTWHFVLPSDIRWMMALTGPRVAAGTRLRMRFLGLDEATLTRALDVIGSGLAGGRRLTRPQIGALLAEHGIHADAGRLGYITAHAELELLVVSGGLDGKQQTYALLDEIAPRTAEPLSREEALAELTRRYFRSHGPAAIADFTWWSSLTVTDTRRALDMLGDELATLEVDGTRYWLDPELADRGTGTRRPAVHLLQAFDEYVVGYQRTRSVLDYEGLSGGTAWNPNTFIHPVIVDGQVVGGWRRAIRKDNLEIETALLRALRNDEQAALAKAIERYGEFVGLRAAAISPRSSAAPDTSGRSA